MVDRARASVSTNTPVFGASRQGLDAECASAGEEVQHTHAIGGVLCDIRKVCEDVEDRSLYQRRSWTVAMPVVGEAEECPITESPPNDLHVTPLRRPPLVRERLL